MPHSPKIYTNTFQLKCMLTRTVWASVAIFLLFGPYLARLMDEGNRISYMWSRSDASYVLLAIVIPAFIFTLIRECVITFRWGKLRLLIDHTFIACVGAGILANLCFWTQREEGYRIAQHGLETRSAWIALAAVIGFSLTRPDFKIVLRVKQLCQIVTPVMLIVIVQLFRASEYPTCHDPLPAEGLSLEKAESNLIAEGSPVYLFILDGWSYQRSFQNEQPIASMTTFQTLSQQAITFHQASSPGDHTSESIPRLLFQTELVPHVSTEHAGFLRHDTFADADQFDTLFDRARQHDYQSALIGFSLPYGRWLEGRVDVCRTYCRYPRGLTPWARPAGHMLEAASYWTDPWSHKAYEKIKTPFANEQYLYGYRHMKDDVLDIIREMPERTMAVFHLPFPHYPYILNEQGEYRGPNSADWAADNVAGYARNLAYMDRMMGEFIHTMKEGGRYENALLIVTSDHTWRYDPDRASGKITAPKTHVPLLIKWPNQHEAVHLRDPFKTVNLGMLTHSALEGDTLAQGLSRLQEHLALNDTPTTDKPDDVKTSIVRR